MSQEFDFGDLPRPSSDFSDVARRIGNDAPQGCAAFAESLSALAWGEAEPEAELHLASCAKCRDEFDRSRTLVGVIGLLSRPQSQAKFSELRFRPRRRIAVFAAAAALLAAILWPKLTETPRTPLQRILDAPIADAAGLKASLAGAKLDARALSGAVVGENRERAVAAVRALGMLDDMAGLYAALGQRSALDPQIAGILARRGVAVPILVALATEDRRDLVAPILEAAPAGSADLVVDSLADPQFHKLAMQAALRVPSDEMRVALNVQSIAPTPEQAAALVDLTFPGARELALQSASISEQHRRACVRRAVDVGALDFLIGAMGDLSLRAEAEAAIVRVPADRLLVACRDALRNPELYRGAARVAQRCNFESLSPGLLEAGLRSPALDMFETDILPTEIDDYDAVSGAACIEALRSFGAERVETTVRAALAGSKDPAGDLRRLVEFRLDGLGPVLVGLLSDPVLRAEAIRGIASLHYKPAVPALAEHFDLEDARAALVTITGKKFDTAVEYLVWWRSQ